MGVGTDIIRLRTAEGSPYRYNFKGTDNMKKKIFNILLVYIFHIVFIVMSYFMMQSDYGNLQVAFIVAGIIYFLYWIISNIKSYMPWIVYLHFSIGAIIQIILNNCGFIPEDAGFLPGLGQLFYCGLVAAHVLLLGLANLILYLIDKLRKKRQAKI